VIELPFGLPGRIFRSPMPFRPGDENGQLFRQYQEWQIEVVVLLADDAECLRRSGRHLRLYYEINGLRVIYLPIPDYDVPTQEGLSAAVGSALACAQAGQNVVVHCYAGYGRTGMFLACMARRALGMSAQEAVEWVRIYVPAAIEAQEQMQTIKEFR